MMMRPVQQRPTGALRPLGQHRQPLSTQRHLLHASRQNYRDTVVNLRLAAAAGASTPLDRSAAGGNARPSATAALYSGNGATGAVLEVPVATVGTETASFMAENPTVEVPPETVAEPVAAKPTFNWFQQWYPVAPVECLDPSRPHPFTLLGQELVLWRDGSGSWRAFRDACPHRLAPLSQGRVEADGTLLCAYHGWRFDGSGACTTIPTCRDEAELKRAVGNPRSCAVQYPTLQRGGLLWVWGEGGPQAAKTSAGKQPALPPEIRDDGTGAPGVETTGWAFRDLPYGHVYFIENVVDPAHVPVSHHKIVGDRYKDARPFQLLMRRPPTADGGFEVYNPDPVQKDMTESSTDFFPPGFVKISTTHTDGGKTMLLLYSTPTVPGRSRHVGQLIRVESPNKDGKRRNFMGIFQLGMPMWLRHTLAALFMHQDMVFLHYQELMVAREQRERLAARAAANGDAPSEGSAAATMPRYYMPTNVDRGVSAWRKWLTTFAGGDVSYALGTPPLPPIVEYSNSPNLFDTWHSHTSQCAVCLAALQRMRTVRQVAVVTGVAAVLLLAATAAARAVVAATATAAAAAAASAAAAVPAAVAAPGVSQVLLAAVGVFGSWEGVLVAALAVVSALTYLVTVKLEELMHKYEFSHADNH